jgi:hypothetical protein
MTIKKLSKAQAEVVRKMKNGWELGESTGLSSRCWLQKGGIGKGGEAQSVSHATATVLLRAGIIEYAKKQYPTFTYKLAPKADHIFQRQS